MRRTLVRIAHEIVEKNPGQPPEAGVGSEAGVALVGIHRRGAALARRLHALVGELLAGPVPLGFVDISFYRDDLGLRRGGIASPVVHATQLDFPLDGRTIVIVDDVLYTSASRRSTAATRWRSAPPPSPGGRRREPPNRPPPALDRRPGPRRDRAHPRHRRVVRRGLRPGDQEGPRAARADDRQPVLRGQHPHQLELRAGRQAAERRRGQHPLGRLERREGGVAQGHRPHPLGLRPGGDRDPLPARWGGGAGGAVDGGGGDQRRRRQARASHPGPAGHLHAAPPAGPPRRRQHLDRRRRPALARGALEHPRLPADGRRGHRVRTAHPDSARDRGARRHRHHLAAAARAGRRGVRAADAARADARRLRALAARVRRALPDQLRAPGPRPAADAPGAGEPRGGAVGRGDRLPAGADRGAGQGGGGGADGGALRAAGRLPAAGGGGRTDDAMSDDRMSDDAMSDGGMTDDARLAGGLSRRAAPPAQLLIRGAHLLDPRTGLDGPHDLLVRDGRIAELGAPGSLPAPAGVEVLDGEGLHVFPGFVDGHVHLRTPGQEYKEDLDSGTAAAAAGGFCAVVAMPNTDPVLDQASTLRALHERARAQARVPVGFLAAITRALAGRELTEMAALADAGALGFTDDGRPVACAGLLRRALQYQRLCGGVIALHEEDPSLSRDGVMHEGAVSARLGMAGIPSVSESTMIARDAALARYEDARVHFLHLSAAESVEALEAARRAGAAVSGEVTPHHLTLTDECVRSLDSRFKVNPPLRAERDRRALIDGLRSGVIDCIATDHAPHARHEKEVPFEEAAMGSTGLETAFAALYSELVRPGILELALVVERLSAGGAIYGLPTPRIAPDAPANLAVVDLRRSFEVGADGYVSRAENCAFHGRRLHGRVVLTLAAGAVAFRERVLMAAVAPR